jgi:hypothetical protein
MDTTHRNRFRPRAAVCLGLVLAAGLAVSACGDDDPAADGTTGSTGTTLTADDQTSSSPSAEVPSREDLAAALAAGDDDTGADLVRDDATEVTPVEVGFLSDWVLLRVESFGTDHGVLRHVAYGAGQAWPVTQPEDFDAMVEADGTGVADAETAEELVRTRLEVTRPSSGFARVVESVDDVEVPGGLGADEEARRDDALAELADELAPPAAEERSEGGWTVTLYAQRTCEQPEPVAQVTREIGDVNPDGTVDQRSEPVVDDLPGPVCAP